ncbi:hypothetical protein B0H14DRAFT_3165607 [Mycena olivaceomarginata]|nr:hypothetical protein B0H14DRAFT_3165607 [Mycena olivaceomarginata]
MTRLTAVPHRQRSVRAGSWERFSVLLPRPNKPFWGPRYCFRFLLSTDPISAFELTLIALTLPLTRILWPRFWRAKQRETREKKFRDPAAALAARTEKYERGVGPAVALLPRAVPHPRLFLCGDSCSIVSSTPPRPVPVPNVTCHTRTCARKYIRPYSGGGRMRAVQATWEWGLKRERNVLLKPGDGRGAAYDVRGERNRAPAAAGAGEVAGGDRGRAGVRVWVDVEPESVESGVLGGVMGSWRRDGARCEREESSEGTDTGRWGAAGFFLFPRLRGRNTGTRAGRVQRPRQRAANEERRWRGTDASIRMGPEVDGDDRRPPRAADMNEEAEQWQYGRSRVVEVRRAPLLSWTSCWVRHIVIAFPRYEYRPRDGSWRSGEPDGGAAAMDVGCGGRGSGDAGTERRGDNDAIVVSYWGMLIINPHNSKKLLRRLTSASTSNEVMGVAAMRGKYHDLQPFSRNSRPFHEFPGSEQPTAHQSLWMIADYGPTPVVLHVTKLVTRVSDFRVRYSRVPRAVALWRISRTHTLVLLFRSVSITCLRQHLDDMGSHRLPDLNASPRATFLRALGGTIEAADQQMFGSTDGGLSESFCGFRQRKVPVTQIFRSFAIRTSPVGCCWGGRKYFKRIDVTYLPWPDCPRPRPPRPRHMPGPNPGGASSNEFKFDPRGAGKFVGV